MHLGLNLLSLVVIGLPTERILGHWRTLIVYLGSAIGSTGAVLLLIQLGLMPSALLVGASGAIFGLIGAQVALLIRAWRVIRSRLAAGRLLNLGLIIMLQAIFDLFTPQVSFSAHASGLLIGLVLTAAVAGAGSNGPASPP